MLNVNDVFEMLIGKVIITELTSGIYSAGELEIVVNGLGCDVYVRDLRFDYYDIQRYVEWLLMNEYRDFRSRCVIF